MTSKFSWNFSTLKEKLRGFLGKKKVPKGIAEPSTIPDQPTNTVSGETEVISNSEDSSTKARWWRWSRRKRSDEPPDTTSGFVSTLKSAYRSVAAYTKRQWQQFRELWERKEGIPIEDVLQDEHEEIEESRKSRIASLSVGTEIEVIRNWFKEKLFTQAVAAGAGAEASAVDQTEVIRKETEAIRKEKSEHVQHGFRPVANEAKNDLVGMCFSGGGIRSATFNLGVITALAKCNYLRQIDYLSTVSGGGYIGSWLTAWIKRDGCDEVEKKLKAKTISAIDRYLEPDPVRFLRKFSNYLAPRTGLMSTDLWALLAVYLRNVTLNLVLLIAVGAFILALPLLAVHYGWVLATRDLQDRFVNTFVNLTRILLVIAMGSIAYSFASFSSKVQPHFRMAQNIVSNPGKWVAAPLLVSGTLMTYLLALQFSKQLGSPLQTQGSTAQLMTFVLQGIFWYLFTTLAGNFASRIFEVFSGWHDIRYNLINSYSGVKLFWKILRNLEWKSLFGKGSGPKPVSKSSTVGLASTILSGALAGLLIYVFGQLMTELPQRLWPSLPKHSFMVQVYADLALWIILGPPLLLGVVVVLSVFHVGLLGRSLADAKREWLSRLCAVLALTGLAWTVGTGLALYGAVVFKFLFLSSWATTTWGRILKWFVASGWLAATVGGVVGGNRSKSKPQGSNGTSRLILKIAPPIFILGLLLLLSWGVDRSLRSRSLYDEGVPAKELTASQYRDMIQKTGKSGSMGDFSQNFGNLLKQTMPPSARQAMDQVSNEHWLYAGKYLESGSQAVRNLTIVLAAVILLLSWRLDVNEFSIHLLYRNRLARCYLGASRKQRQPQPFTGFDVGDDLPLASLRVDPNLYDQEPDSFLRRPYHGPYHLVCAALNLVSGKELAWQTRKARSFVYSPLYCGYDYYAGEQSGKDAGRGGKKLSDHAYRPTELFSGWPGPYLGTALAISGAAATPNMGYHSSPALTFLMGVFNVRLGWWAGNPRHKRTWTLFGPRLALYLGLELMGRTDDEKAFVYLSDGGHFENLGLYELVRRKCRYVIASDAVCDPEYSFSDLGNAIQKCRRDLGAEIIIDVSKLRPKADSKLSGTHYAFGNIIYNDGTEGTLLYLKSSLKETDRQDVHSFAREDGAFPHDTTADQFFNEVRFESYRALGEDVFDSVLQDVKHRMKNFGAGSPPIPPIPPATIAGLFTFLEQIYAKVEPKRKGSFDLEEVQVATMKFSFETE